MQTHNLVIAIFFSGTGKIKSIDLIYTSETKWEYRLQGQAFKLPEKCLQE